VLPPVANLAAPSLLPRRPDNRPADVPLFGGQMIGKRTTGRWLHRSLGAAQPEGHVRHANLQEPLATRIATLEFAEYECPLNKLVFAGRGTQIGLFCNRSSTHQAAK